MKYRKRVLSSKDTDLTRQMRIYVVSYTYE